MKKFIQISAVLSLVFIFSAVAAHAQTGDKTYDANISFDFNIGNKTYSAGHYVLRISRTTANVVQLTVEDDKRNVLQSMLVAQNGSNAESRPHLVFNVYENQRFLTKILTTEREIAVGESKTEKEVARKQKQNKAKTPAVAVNLQN